MERLIRAREAAELLQVSVASLRQWDIKGTLVAIRTPGGHRRYRVADIERLCTQKPKLTENPL